MAASGDRLTQEMDRRRLLRTTIRSLGAALSSSVLSGLLTPSFAQQGPASIDEVPLRGDLDQISGAGGNVVLLTGRSGTAMVDSGSPEHSADLVARVFDRPNASSPDLLFNTHWHLAHTGANEAVGRTGARIIAHENTRLWMSTEYYVDWQDRSYPPRPTQALPTHTFYSSDPQPITMEFGNENIEYGHLREAHTDGDIYVFFREHNVIVAGGAMTVGAYPVLDFATGGWIGGLMDSTEKLLEMADSDTLIVPDVGPPQSRKQLAAQYEMVSTVRSRVEDLMRQGKSAEEMLAAEVTAEFDEIWGQNRERFIANVYGGLWWQGRLDGSL